MWPFKKRIDSVSMRLSNHASDIYVLYTRLYQIERYVTTLDKRVSDLEKILKSCNITVTVINKD